MADVPRKQVVLTPEEYEELSALEEANEALDGPSSIMRFHWHKSGYANLVRRGLVEWGPAPRQFSNRRWAGTIITDKGRLAIRAYELAVE